MSSKLHGTISKHLAAAQLMLDNTLAQPEILEAVRVRGYSEVDLAEGQRLQRRTTAAVAAQSLAAGEARRTTEQANAAEQQARVAYQGLVQTVRAIYPANTAQRTMLKVVGPMPVGTAKFIAAATILFSNALNATEIAGVLAKYGYEETTLQHEHALILRYQQIVQAQALAKGAAKRATQAQTKAHNEMQQWITRYAKITKIALRTRPDLLKALGITMQNGRSEQNSTPEESSPPPAPPQS
jgi:hypothetical protein